MHTPENESTSNGMEEERRSSGTPVAGLSARTMTDLGAIDQQRNVASRPPLIESREPASGDAPTLGLALALVALLTVVSFWPTLQNGFLPLGFDDAIITDSVAIRGLGPSHLWSMATELNHAHYVPLTMLSLAVDHYFWGRDPFGYHLTNVVLHGLAAMLVCVFLWPLAPSRFIATVAALLFAVHPVQMEAVSVAMQRKTLLSGLLFFLTLILYRKWRASPAAWLYVATLFCFVAAALAKPVVMSLPLFLLLYDHVFEGGRLRIVDKLPFFAVSAAVAIVAYAAHVSVGAVHPPHGGSLLTHVLMVSRVTFEYVSAILLPFALSPIYYYPHSIAHSPLNYLAMVTIPLVCALVVWRRHRHPWVFFCVGWFVLALLPESNLTPLAQLRADRFLYVSIVGAGLGFGILIERIAAGGDARARRPLFAYAVGAVVVAALAVTTRTSAAIWHDDVSAWNRVVKRHPWSATAAVMLARAHASAGDPAKAEAILLDSIQLHPDLAAPQLALARLYYEHGKTDLAELRLQRVFDLSPDDEQGRALQASLREQEGER
jgi:hypothetical protein